MSIRLIFIAHWSRYSLSISVQIEKLKPRNYVSSLTSHTTSKQQSLGSNPGRLMAESGSGRSSSNWPLTLKSDSESWPHDCTFAMWAIVMQLLCDSYNEILDCELYIPIAQPRQLISHESLKCVVFRTNLWGHFQSKVWNKEDFVSSCFLMSFKLFHHSKMHKLKETVLLGVITWEEKPMRNRTPHSLLTSPVPGASFSILVRSPLSFPITS